MQQVGVQVERVPRHVNYSRHQWEPQVEWGSPEDSEASREVDSTLQVAALGFPSDLRRMPEQVGSAGFGELDRRSDRRPGGVHGRRFGEDAKMWFRGGNFVRWPHGRDVRRWCRGGNFVRWPRGGDVRRWPRGRDAWVRLRRPQGRKQPKMVQDPDIVDRWKGNDWSGTQHTWSQKCSLLSRVDHLQLRWVRPHQDQYQRLLVSSHPKGEDQPSGQQRMDCS